jgi:hypothetical protein
MTEDERQALLAAAYARPLEDPIARWRREGEAIKVARERGRAELKAAEAAHVAQQQRDWETWVDARIAAASVEHDRCWTDIFGQVVAHERHKMRAEVAEQIGQLRAELAVQRAAEKADVIDLPALPRRRVHAA